MIGTGIDTRIKIQDVLANQLPKFILDESPYTVDFLNQYYISQEYQGAPIDISENLDQYINLDNLTPNVIQNSTTSSGITTIGAKIINVVSTKGFPNQYGLLKIDDEIITYTGITTNTFTGCKRGFSGITSYHSDTNKEDLVFSSSSAAEHESSSTIQNLSVLFLKEFYQKIKSTFTPGLEKTDFTESLNVGNFLKNARTFYQTKGTDESFRILFNVLYNISPTIINLENNLIKPSTARYIRSDVAIAEAISGDPLKLKGQALFKSDLGNTNINTAISEVEPFTRNNKQYFKFNLFVGYDNESEISEDFKLIPSTKCLENVSIGASVINVDSTIGFGTTGSLTSGLTTFTYEDKTINQFLNCTGISSSINNTDSIKSSTNYYGYEDGDLSKKVELNFTGVLKDFETIVDFEVEENDSIFVRNVGTKIINPSSNKSYKETFANSWIYNTSSTYEIDEFLSNSSITLNSDVDRSSLKVGDKFELLKSGTNEVVYPIVELGNNTPYIDEIVTRNSLSLANFNFSRDDNEKYKLRRKINKASSSNTSPQIEFGNQQVISDIQNLYVDNADEFAYVASNSLPSYNFDLIQKDFKFTDQITTKVLKSTLNLVINTSGELSDLNSDEKFTSIIFNEPVEFLTGSKVFHQPTGEPLVGLDTGSYYVSFNPTDNNKKLRLFNSRTSIPSNSFLSFTAPTGISTHVFILEKHKSETISPQKLLKKFPLQPNIKNGIGETTNPGGLGLLINGVEISNYKSLDKIYFGPLKSTKVLNGGSEFDIINPPEVVISTGIGTTALVKPSLSGSIKKIFVDPQNFDVEEVVSIGVTGGNGVGCVLKPILTERFREVVFDSRNLTNGGGINTSTNSIIFLENHGFLSGEEITYDSNLGTQVSTSTTSLINGSNYFVKNINNLSIQLFNTKSDLENNTNQVNFKNGGSGLQKFRTKNSKNTLNTVEVLNEGKNYKNKTLLVKPTGISTQYNKINFVNHRFNDGDIVQYTSVVGLGSTLPQLITGLTTTNDYYVLKDDNDSFRLCDAGIAGTIFSNYQNKNIVEISSTGTGYQQFTYPKIQCFVDIVSVGVGTTSIELTPMVNGSIISLDMYESGTGYGSTILNLHKKPNFKVKNGNSAILTPNILNGKINSVSIEFGGFEYFSTPKLSIVDETGSGRGGEIRAVVSNQKIVDVVVTQAGIGYSTSSNIVVTSSGKNQVFDCDVRDLTLNETYSKNELLTEIDGTLKYSVCGYSTQPFRDGGDTSSNIIGWAYDGNPIYGPYGLKDPEGSGTDVILLQSSYILDTSYNNRPSITLFPEGFFADDYKFNNSGDLDQYNGRFEKNSDFPDGVYAYHALINSVGDSSYPYFIGDQFRSNLIKDNVSDLNQSFNFNDSDLRRNTFPYKVFDQFADNYFLIETNEITRQKSVIESVEQGSISKINVANAGKKYKVNDTLNFDNSDTNGDGLISKIVKIKGKEISEINTIVEKNENSVLTWSQDEITITTNESHKFIDKDFVSISGVTTSSFKIDGFTIVGVKTFTSSSLATITSGTAGVSTEIFVSNIPSNVSSGATITVGIETMKVLNVFNDLNVLRVKRGLTGISHSESSSIVFQPTEIKLKKSVPSFDSKVNDKIFFNPAESIGIGTTAGLEHSTTFRFAGRTIDRSIPTQRILLQNHPFSNNQQITFTKDPTGGNISVSTTPTSSTFNLPTSNLFVVDSGKDLIGLKTGLGNSFNELFFRDSAGANNKDEYLFESGFRQITCDILKTKSTVTLSTSHTLKVDDIVSLKINPSLNVGVGTSASVKLTRDIETGHLLVDTVGFNSTGINTTSNTINITSHKFETGDKVKYSSDTLPLGLLNKDYFVYKVDNNNINLSETKIESLIFPPKIIGIGSTGGLTQSLSKINPQINISKNNNIVFDLSDSSLSGYQLQIFYDNNFINKFTSIGSTTTFNVVNVGSSLTVSYGSSLPSKLYYNISKSGFISTADKEVTNYSTINYIDSNYNNDYKISSIGSTTFDIFLKNEPERLSYENVDVSLMEYDTTSVNDDGGIDTIEILSGGSNYKKFPSFVGSSSSIASDAIINFESDTIGKIKKVRVVSDSYEYSTDKTLNPDAAISPILKTKNANTIGIVSITSGGSNFIDTPKVIIVNSDTGIEINSGFLNPILLSNSIIRVDVIENPSGLPDNDILLKSVNNTNGITISSVESNSGTAFTCVLSTPTNGFPVEPFKVGDNVFIEGIQKYSEDGTGFNSSDYKYTFFRVSEYNTALNPRKVKISVSGLTTTGSTGVSTNVGLAKTEQNNFATMINESDYPVFESTLIKSTFEIGEKIIVNNFPSDLKVSGFNENNLKVSGSFTLKIGDLLKGETSQSTAEIREITENKGIFSVGFSNRKNIGWDDEIGKLSVDSQVTPDNDYYQNLSYSIKSPITWSKLETPVNNLLHTAGLKNFADTEVISSSSVGIGSSAVTSITIDLIENERVDIIKNIDLGVDKDSFESKSKFIQLDKTRLVDYVECNTNNVLSIDNIRSEFSKDDGDPDDFLNLLNLNNGQSFTNLLVKIESNNKNEIQLSDLIILNTTSSNLVSDNNILLVKSELNNSGIGFTNYKENNYGSFSIQTNDIEESVLRFIPKDPFTTDYNVKILKNIFNTNRNATSGIGSISLNVIELISSNLYVSPSSSANIVSLSSSKFQSYFANTQIIDPDTDNINFVETYVTHDGTNTYLAEFYSDTNLTTKERIGIFSGDLSGGNFQLKFENNISTSVTLKSKIIGIGTTGLGDGEYRFKSTDQSDGQERSVLLQGIAKSGVGTTSFVGLSSNLFDSVKSIVEVSVGSSKALHQISIIHDNTSVYVQPAQFLSVSGTSIYDDGVGLGTFSGQFESGNLVVKFHPDDLTGICTVNAFNKCFYSSFDTDNTPLGLNYGEIVESIDVLFYNGINGDRINKTDFELKSNGIPIFSKTFNPTNNSILNPATGLFTIENHFFRNNEELIYEFGSTIVGVGSTSITYKNAGVSTYLPKNVFCITDSENTFSISTTRSGTAVTFTDLGEGNAHSFSMSKNKEKTIITIDGITQSPITPTNIVHILENNNQPLSASSSIFSLSGISSIQVTDILKINDEFMEVTNVGIGTTFAGPITPGIGTFPLVQVGRGFLGSKATTHSQPTNVNLFKGSFDIVKEKIHFTEPPRGNPQGTTLASNLPFPRSTFTGRVYLRNSYDTNVIFDDVSDQFTGIDSSFTLKVGAADTVGVGTTGNGLLLLNGVFQTPTTFNNADGNFEIVEDAAAGVSTVKFTGLIESNNIVISDEDVNQNQLPRGGVIVSLGSTPGLGFAPLKGANLKAKFDSNGTITGVVGVATTGASLGIVTAFYNNTTGILTITTQTDPDWAFGDQSQDEVQLINVPFSGGLSIGGTFPVVSVAATNIIGVNIGQRSTSHLYNGGGEILPFYGDLTFGSGYNGIGGIGVTVFDPGYIHRFISANTGAINRNSDAAQLTPTSADYDPKSGIITFTVNNHGMSTNDLITIDDYSLTYTCSKDNYFTEHSYPRSTDPLGGGISTAITKVTDNIFSANVGTNVGSGADISVSSIDAGGSLSFSIGAGGTDYKNPKIFVSSPSYENLPITGLSRLGIGPTTETGSNLKVTLNVGPVSTNVGIGSTLFEVKNFKLKGNGNAFKIGDKFTVVGLVTDSSYAQPVKNFELEVTKVFQDDFTLWQFGELDFIDSIKQLQNGERVRFPLKYNNSLISIEEGTNYTTDLANVLLVMRNGVVQDPSTTYNFKGGTSIIFIDPPEVQDNIQIYFYKGTTGVDSIVVDAETSPIEVGDELQLLKNPSDDTTISQTKRRFTSIRDSDELETNIYYGEGVNENIFKPVNLFKQKTDLEVNGIKIPKTRNLIETYIFPTAKVIGKVSTTDQQLFFDDVSLFNYEDDASPNFSFRLISGAPDPVPASLSANVSSAGTITSLNIINGGSGYIGATTSISIGIPTTGIGTTANPTATATATIGAGGTISVTSIVSGGIGYTSSNPPSVLIPRQDVVEERISGSNISILSTSGIITGITTTTFNSKLSIEFTGINTEGLVPLQIGDPIFVYDTTVGNGVTSTDGVDTNVVGIGTSFVDNVYIIAGITTLGVVGGGNTVTGIITCTIDSNSVGIGTTISTPDLPVGKFSLGKMSNLTRSSSPISIGVTGLTVDVGLTTFPIIIRNSGEETLRKTGALKTPGVS